MRNIIVAIACTAAGSELAWPQSTTPAPSAQDPPANYGCPGPEYQQFKFWVGEWTVARADNGKHAGVNKVELLDAGCSILESWTSATPGGTGHSINVYDQADGKWHQTWVDMTGDQVHYIGTWTNGKMEFRADDMATPQKQKVVLTMTFEPRADGTIRQSGTQSTDGGKAFTPTFDLVYTRKK